jgi:hypothetical protein
MKPQAAVQSTTGATVLEESYRRTPTALGHLPEDLLRAVTALVALAEVVLWWLVATLAAEAAAAGAPHTGLEGEPVAEAISEAEATQTVTSSVSHATATMPVAESGKFDASHVIFVLFFLFLFFSFFFIYFFFLSFIVFFFLFFIFYSSFFMLL